MTDLPDGDATSRPPRFAAWLLERAGQRDRGASMVGDLNEEYARYVRPNRSAAAAAFWYWRQVIRSLPTALIGRRRGYGGGRPSDHGRDIRHAVRSVVRAPRFSLTVILILGLGVGAGMSVFSLVDVLLLRPPPHVEDASRVRRLVLHENRPPFGAFTSASLAWIDYEAMRSSTGTLDDVAAYWATEKSLGRGIGARRITTMIVTPSFFSTLRVRPALGRFFDDSEDVVGADPMPCVASHTFWKDQLDGDDEALGRVLTVGGVSCVVVGVTPPHFNGVELGRVHLWLPIRPAATDSYGTDGRLWTTDRSHWIRVIARLAPGITDEVANERATAAYRAVTDRHRDPDLTGVAEWLSIMPGRSSVRGAVVSTSTLLFAGCVLLFLLVTVNLANLFVVRDLGRLPDTAVRLALGASRWHLFRTRVWETGILAVGAGALGLGVASWIGPVINHTLMSGLELTGSIVTWRVAAVAFAITFVTGSVIAVASTLRAGKVDPARLLQSAGSARSGVGRRASLIRLSLVGIQAAVSVALLVASFGFVNSFRRASDVNIGFDRSNLLVATVPLGDVGFSLVERQAFYHDLWERLRSLPGVTSASLGYTTPWWNNRGEPIRVPGRDSLPPDPNFGTPAFDTVTPDYLRTLGLTMRIGRWLSERDVAGGAPVVVINEALRDLYWPGQNPIGRCMYIGNEPTPCREIVGIVASHRFTGGLDDPPIAGYFLPLAQSDEYHVTPRLFVRMRDAPDGTGAAVNLRRFIQGAAPDLPASRIVSMEALFGPLVAPWRLGAFVFTGLGVLATIVGSLGLFSVLSFVVAQRRREFAIRAAVGATSRQIAVPVVRQGVFTVIAGVVGGFGMAMVASTWLQPLLFHTRITDPVILCAVAALSLTVASAATLAPAHSAASRDPMTTLRIE